MLLCRSRSWGLAPGTTFIVHLKVPSRWSELRQRVLRQRTIDIMHEIVHINNMDTAYPHSGIEQFAEVARSARVAGLCRDYGVHRLSAFGSVLDRARRPDSDLDLIVEFYPGRTPGFAFARLAEQLSEVFGVRVDLHTHNSLSKYFRDEVLREAREIYAGKE
jgi:predicted nucleotidyltransferase